jgi:hypothetical protein
MERDVAKAAEGEFGNRFLPDTQAELARLTTFAKQIEEPMRTLKLAGTGGGGSQTGMQLVQILSNALDLVPGGGILRAPLAAAIKGMRTADQQRLAYLLLNPEEAAKALERAAVAGAKLSPAESVVAQIAGSASRGGATAAAAGPLGRALGVTDER